MATTLATSPPVRFRALRTHQDAAGVRSAVETLSLEDLSPGELQVRVRWAGVNYKDSLAVTGGAKIITAYPRVAGIELVGRVEHSEDARFAPGDEVLVHGFDTGIAFDGGFAERARVPAAHAMKLPDGLDVRQAAVLGVPGFTVALALERFERLGLQPGDPVAVSGAGGAVGMLAVAILSRAGYRVAALTRSAARADALRALGAEEVVTTDTCMTAMRPLETARYAAAIDNVGGAVLSWLLRSLRHDGRMAVVGNASGIRFEANVLPFFMRNVQMFGVMANADRDIRARLWARLAGPWKPDFDALAPHVRDIGIDDLLPHCRAQVGGRTSGRTLVSMAG